MLEKRVEGVPVVPLGLLPDRQAVNEPPHIARSHILERLSQEDPLARFLSTQQFGAEEFL